MDFTVRNSDSTGGWVARMINSGFRVLSRPVRFGESKYIVKADREFIEFTQAPSRGRKVRFDAPTDSQQRIIDALISFGVFAV
jgi:hypothetical protein